MGCWLKIGSWQSANEWFQKAKDRQREGLAWKSGQCRPEHWARYGREEDRSQVAESGKPVGFVYLRWETIGGHEPGSDVHSLEVIRL